MLKACLENSPGRRALACAMAIVVHAALAPTVRAQHSTDVAFSIDPKTSLAWWQINPNYGHLWASTCPQDPSWQPGEGRTLGMLVDYTWRPQTRDTGYLDNRIPLFPRRRVHPLCSEAVSGEITVGDTTTWNDMRGQINVMAEYLRTGFDLRDAYARRAVYEINSYPQMKFALDSVTNVQKGDTIRAVAVGTFEMHGVKTPLRTPVKAWREPSGLRVQIQWMMPAKALLSTYQMSRMALELGIISGRWQEAHMGADVILLPRH